MCPCVGTAQAPKEVSVLIPRSWECGRVMGRLVTQVGLGSSQGSLKRGVQEGESQRRCEDGSRGHRDATGGRVYELWNAGCPREQILPGASKRQALPIPRHQVFIMLLGSLCPLEL